MFSFGYSRIALQSKWRYGAIGGAVAGGAYG